ncbi:NAD(P)-dependent oxidoreductase [Emticicia sp. SJ17W-69]|uniref:NAD(P)-dependent oxidoreductase n=1 Tax=Emticicia sp. SJ17W-69 TaxID=3421657 RepID=UPI003EC017A9
MAKFRQIVCVDNTRLTAPALEKLSQYSEQEVKIFNDYPTNKDEIINRIGDADCLLVSWKTTIDKEIIENANALKYIGMCCSLIDKTSANVNIDAAEERKIVVKGVKDYGDEGVVEFIFAELISLAKGLRKHQWKSIQTELKGKTLGIIGFGTVGQMVAKVAIAFGMNVLYFSRTRKRDAETANLKYVNLSELLSKSDVISTHLPRKTKLLSKDEFALIKPNAVFINTSVGVTFDEDSMYDWVKKEGNYAIFDHDGAFGLNQLEKYPNIIYSPKTSGMTDAAFERLSDKVIQNLTTFISNSNI